MYKQQNLLKIPEIYDIELGKLMYKILHRLIPTAVKKEFIASTSVHNHYIRLLKKDTTISLVLKHHMEKKY